MSELMKPTVEFDEMSPIGNINWQIGIDEGVTSREFDKQGLVPRPDSIASFLGLMQLAFKSEKVSDFKCAYQFHLSGDVEGRCYHRIQEVQTEVGTGVTEEPDVTILTACDVWIDILKRKTDGAKASWKKNTRLRVISPI